MIQEGCETVKKTFHRLRSEISKRQTYSRKKTVEDPNPVTGDIFTKVTEIKAHTVIVKEVNVTKEPVKKYDSDEKECFVECKLCDYKCQKDTTLKKHTNTKHQEYNCKVCNKKVSNSMELLQHTAKEYSEAEEINIRDI